MESFDSGHAEIPAGFEDKILTGDLVKLWPFARGYYRRDLYYLLWRMMEDERMTDTIFYRYTTAANPTPIDTHMDLTEFVQYFSLAIATRLLLIPTYKETGEMIGFSWYDDVVLGESATGNMFYRKKFWGEVAREATELALRYGFGILQLKKVWAYSPWLASVKHRARLGFTEITEIPEAVKDRSGKMRTMYIGALKKEDFHNGR